MNIAFRFEPAAWLGAFRMVIYTAGVFGVLGVDAWTEEQKTAAIVAFETVLGLIQRSVVVPVAHL